MTIEFTATTVHDVNFIHMLRDYPHIITPADVGIDDPIERCEVLQFEADASIIHGVAILRVYLMPEKDRTQLVLTQHLSERVSAKMGSTAMLCPIKPELAITEQTIAANARTQIIKAIRDERRRRHGKG